MAMVTDDIVGPRDYRKGREPDPDSVGVRALDPLTLEVRLSGAVAYFIYLAAMPPFWPVPRRGVQESGNNRWQPDEHHLEWPL